MGGFSPLIFSLNERRLNMIVAYGHNFSIGGKVVIVYENSSYTGRGTMGGLNGLGEVYLYCASKSYNEVEAWFSEKDFIIVRVDYNG
jgi:hypothetical protein